MFNLNPKNDIHFSFVLAPFLHRAHELAIRNLEKEIERMLREQREHDAMVRMEEAKRKEKQMKEEQQRRRPAGAMGIFTQQRIDAFKEAGGLITSERATAILRQNNLM